MANDKVISREESRSFDRYLFDTDFFEIDVAHDHTPEEQPPLEAEESAAAQPPAAPKAITEEDLAQAESEGYAAGLAEGKAHAAEDFKQQLQTHVSAFAASLGALETLKTELSSELSQKAVRLLAGLLPNLLADAQKNYPEALLQRTADRLLETLRDEKVLLVTTAPKTKDFLLSHIAEAEGLKAKLKPEQFRESHDLEVGDCIIEWETGGVTLSHADILQQLTDILLAAAPADKKTQREPIKATAAMEEKSAAEVPQARLETEAQPAPKTAQEPEGEPTKTEANTPEAPEQEQPSDDNTTKSDPKQ